MKLELKRSSTDNQFCVPAALALITQLPLSKIENLLRDELGDVPITGLYYPIGLKILVRLGYSYKKIELIRLDVNRLNPESFYYCTQPGHCFVIHDNLWWDNQYPNGISFSTEFKKRVKVTQCYEITKSVKGIK